MDDRERADQPAGNSNGATGASRSRMQEKARGEGAATVNGHRDRGLRRGLERVLDVRAQLRYGATNAWLWPSDHGFVIRHPQVLVHPRNRLITTYTSLRWDASQGLSLIWVIPGPRSS